MSEPTQETIREVISAQTCPWCRRGPFRSLACHTWQAHGVTRFHLREIAGLNSRVSICSEDYSADRREEVLRRPDWRDSVAKATEASRQAEAWKIASSASVRAGGQQLAAAARVEKLARRNVGRDERIIRLFRSGHLLADIAEAVGTDRNTVTRVLRAAGVSKQDVWAQMAQHPKVAAAAGPRCAKARSARKANLDAERQARIREYRELGGNRQAVPVLAARWQVKEPTVVAYLKRAGLPTAGLLSGMEWNRPSRAKPEKVTDDG